MTKIDIQSEQMTHILEARFLLHPGLESSRDNVYLSVVAGSKKNKYQANIAIKEENSEIGQFFIILLGQKPQIKQKTKKEKF